MPTTKISELEELTTAPADNDIMVVVDASTNETKKQEVSNFLQSPTIPDLTVTTAATFFGATIANGGTVTTTDINGGTIDGTVIGGSSSAAGTFTDLTATGTTTLTDATLTTADVNSGTIDNTVIGGATAAAGTFTTLVSDGLVGDSLGTNQYRLKRSDTQYIDFSADASSQTIKTTSGANKAFILGTADSNELRFVANNTRYASILSNGDISFYEDTGTTAKFFWDASAESLGIGTSSPSAKLDIESAVSGGTTYLTEHLALTNTQTGAAGNEATLGFHLNNTNWGAGTTFARVSGYLENGTTGATALVFGTAANGSAATAPERMRLDSAGNLGLGVTPSGWNSSFSAMQLGNSGYLFGRASQTQMEMGNNAVFDATDTRWEYITTNTAQRYLQDGTSGSHQWFTAPSGTAGAAISFTQAMTLDASGNLMIGTTTTGGGGGVTALTLNNATYGGMVEIRQGGTLLSEYYADTGGTKLTTRTALPLVFQTNSTERLRIDSSGKLLIGASSSDLSGTSQAMVIGSGGLAVQYGGNTGTYLKINPNAANGSVDFVADARTGNYPPIVFKTSNTERLRIDSSGNVGIGTSSPNVGGASSNYTVLTVAGSTAGYPGVVEYVMPNYPFVGGDLGLTKYFNGTNENARVSVRPDGNNNDSAFYAISTRQTGGSLTERARISSNGIFMVGTTNTTSAANGLFYFPGDGANTETYLVLANERTDGGGETFIINRQSSDGILIQFRQANSAEGTISVSGTTVSYNGGHLSRWAQTTTAKDESLVKGTVLSNLDEMNVYVDADGNAVDNEQLNKVKVSDVEGDANVAGVFVNWTYDEAHSVDEINMAMTGDMIIRIAQGTTVQRGDLLMSAGDGTAKPQGDDIVRSKTIAKVTSTHVTCTYADGSYCVPCVLMAC